MVKVEPIETGIEVYSDQFGEIRLVAESSTLKLTWTTRTAQMSEENFRQWLQRFADAGDDCGCRFRLIDARLFGYRPPPGFGEWRDGQIIPRYCQQKVEKFAFLLAEGKVPAANPAAEGAATFPTGYFDSAERVTAWFSHPN